jgi:hypothetical protein
MTTMTPGRWINLVAAALGALGAIILFFKSWTLEPLGGGSFGGPQFEKHRADVKARNAARIRWQRVGLVLILASFVVQGAAQFD